MLIEFSLENFRSFAGEQTLSLVASKLKDRNAGQALGVAGTDLSLLTSVVMLGKNGSGKSNLIAALAFIDAFVRGSASAERDASIPWHPNKLKTDLRKKDSSYRLVYSYKRRVYQYAFSHNAKRVTRESLSVSHETGGRFRSLFSRSWTGSSYRYVFGSSLKGDKSVWRAATRENALFLSTANQLNSKSLREPYDWIARYLHTYDSTRPATGYTTRHCLNESNAKAVSAFLTHLDIPIARIDVREREVDATKLRELFREDFISTMESEALQLKDRNPVFVHEDDRGAEIALEESDESTGTNVLFGLAGPLLDSLQNGYCIAIDEINTSLHPWVLRSLVEMFSNEKINRKRAQLIFTSHDTSLLKDKFFRRDQIWFVDKDEDGVSTLTPLSDFSPRKDEAVEKGYLTGRYGGIPYIEDLELAFADLEELWCDVA